MKLIIVLLLLECVSDGWSQTNYTFSYKMASKCKEFNSLHGYKYEKFFRAETDLSTPANPNVMFEMHFAILAASNGHVLLSSIPEPTPSDPVYEFVIGGGGNKFSELRRNLRKNAKGSVITRGILSPIEFRAFYIKIDESGTVQFGKEGDPLPLINYVDVDPIPIRYFSFASWKDEAKYLYDCPVVLANGTEISAPNVEEVELNMTGEARLKKSLLEIRSMNMPPASTVDVKMDFHVKSVKYDPFASRLSTEFIMIITWKDDGMAWNPKKFNYTWFLSFKPSEIWKPSFIEASSIAAGPLESGNMNVASNVVLTSSGMLSFGFANKVDTWCSDESGKLNRWPNDEYTCQIVLEPWNAHEDIKLTLYTLGPTTKLQPHQGWVIEHSQLTLNITTLDSALEYNDNEFDIPKPGDRVVVNITLKRIGTSYNIALYTPLIVLIFFVLMSFWTQPLTTARIWFYAGSSTFISFGLSYVDYFVPCHTIPSILILYTCILGGTLLALLINVALIHAPEEIVFKNRQVQSLLTMKGFRSMFCLPDLKTIALYETIDEDQSSLEDSRSVMEMQDENNAMSERDECANVIDKILFAVYSLTFSVLLASHY